MVMQMSTAKPNLNLLCASDIALEPR